MVWEMKQRRSSPDAVTEPPPETQPSQREFTAEERVSLTEAGEAALESSDAVMNPPHYTRLNPQPLEVCEAWQLEHHEACAVKYIGRAGFKGDRCEDLRKAINYLERKIGLIERGEWT